MALLALCYSIRTQETTGDSLRAAAGFLCAGQLEQRSAPVHRLPIRKVTLPTSTICRELSMNEPPAQFGALKLISNVDIFLVRADDGE